MPFGSSDLQSARRRLSSSSSPSSSPSATAQPLALPVPSGPTPARKRSSSEQQYHEPFNLMQIMPMLMILSVAACAFLAATGFRGRVTIIGVDLGTTYSVVCVRGKQGGIGEVEVILDEDTFDGVPSPIVPSVVSFTDEGEIVTGSRAKQIWHSRRPPTPSPNREH